MAKLFPNAFPPIVKAATKDVTISVTISKFQENLDDKIIAIDEASAPLIIPQISPITSLQKLDSFSAFFINVTAKGAPLTFLDAIELNVLISATVTLIPIISNSTPINITISNNIILINIPTLDITISDNNEKPIDIQKATIVINPIQCKSIDFLFETFFLLTFLEYFSLYCFLSFFIFSPIYEMAINIVNSVP